MSTFSLHVTCASTGEHEWKREEEVKGKVGGGGEEGGEGREMGLGEEREKL